MFTYVCLISIGHVGRYMIQVPWILWPWHGRIFRVAPKNKGGKTLGDSDIYTSKNRKKVTILVVFLFLKIKFERFFPLNWQLNS